MALGNQTVVAEIAREISTLTNKSDDLSPGNLKVSVEMLNQLAILRSNSTDIPSENELESFVQATSNVLRPINSEKWKEIEEVNDTFASAILFSVDVYGRSLSMLNVSNCSNAKGAVNLVLEAWSLEKSSQPPPSQFPNCSLWDENKISISTQAPNTSISSERFHPATRMWASYYQTIHDYLPTNVKFGNISSKVLSFTIDGLRINEKLKYPVNITLQHTEAKDMSFLRTCAYWNFNRSDWDSTGCSMISTTLTHTICSCDHLTNFAVLMRGATTPSMSLQTVHVTALDNKVLSFITIIGCSISVVALIITIIIYALTWKQAKSAQAAVLLNLCVALIIAYVIFIIGAEKDNHKVGCIVVAVLLHYFFLAAFFIMLAEGVELLLYIIFVFHVRRTRETIMLIATAWVLPLIIVTVSVAFTRLDGYGNYRSDGNETTKPLLGNGNYGNGYKNDISNKNETSDVNHGVGDVCWLSAEKGLIWAFIGPVLCIIVVNFVILITVLVWMSERKSLIANNEKKRNEIRATLWNLSVICPVLGLGWLFGVLTISFDHVVFQYLFVIANTLQGLFIFIFHALFHNKKVKEMISDFYSDYICRCRKTVYGVSNKMSSTQELTKKKDNPGSFFQMTGHDNKGLEAQESFLSAGTQTTSMDESCTLETTP